MNFKTIILAGATGFLGGHIARALLERDCHVIALIRRSSNVSKLPKSSKFSLYNIESLDRAELKNLMESSDACVNATTSYARGDLVNIEAVWLANVEFPLMLLSCAISACCPVFINFDSFFSKPELDHDHQPEYTATKRLFLQKAEIMLGCDDVLTTMFNLRLEHLYGPGDSSSKFVPWLLTSLIRNVNPINLTSGNQLRDFIFVDDAVSAMITVLKQAEHNPGRITTYSVGTGKAISIRKFSEEAMKLSGSDSELQFGFYQITGREIASSQANTMTLNALGWKPQVKLRDGIAKTLASISSISSNKK